MSLTTESDICHLIEQDPWRMEMLRFARAMNLPDWCIGAGFVRAAVWDALTNNATPFRLPDLDLIYFNPSNIDPTHDSQLQGQLIARSSCDLWDVKNQARMHLRNDDPPYKDTSEAVSNWLETPTCVAIRLEHDDTLTLISPHGIVDLLGLHSRPTAAALRKPDQYRSRMKAKNWAAIWPGLVVEDC
ncbi:MAG: nucleotidyltransferase family protein [Rhodospirillales bacterium]|jgi:uncharacterized protein|nr:nucleotidyltransferase family protein [Rhodospirillales bacterium]MBT4041292.1 nucleotidyltransferase family protein [Rhodospirillales bacterium]MBT4626690.1 nucleotidyltransferase family protein [Rhodospirillales bacterium]MBT5352516.1 nucleotidyltransferase family protein [Rhodospirillales bacterium]MBT5519496.1 nucleotidyltransferase family protein [Rhodospirillales bacterium]